MDGPEDKTHAATVAEVVTDPADVELPKSIVQRLVRSKAVQIIESKTAGGADKKQPNVQIAKDALLAFSESGKVFINYLASTANDFAKEGKRVTISAADVFKALEELEFGELVQPLQQYLEAHKGTLKDKPATAKKKEGGSTAAKKEGASTAKKRKTATEATTPAAGDDAAVEGTGAGEETAADAAVPSPVPLAAMQPENVEAAEEPADAMQE